MKKVVAILLCASVAYCAETIKGIDVSSYQPNVNWPAVKAAVDFVYIKATESTNYRNPEFSKQYAGASQTGLIRGAYHFARPAASSGAAQAQYFLANGGRWSGDGRTLPGSLDLEAGCSGLSPPAMVQWIREFSDTYERATGRPPVIYTTTSWWQQCTGNNASFGAKNPLWLARYGPQPGPLPAGWVFYSFWQYTDNASPNPGDGDYWNGSLVSLQKFARGG
jgi:GH25 family lysozyme M1 (1,4-beta-N-acetylmuramidase)